MIVTFDTNSMILKVNVGTLEEYKPSEEMKQLQNQVDSLRKKIEEFKNEHLNPEVESIKEKIEAMNKPYIE